MNRYVSIICIIAAIIAAVGVFAYNFFEIYETEVYDSPSAEVRANDFLALERWLIKNGHPVTIWPHTLPGNVPQITENIIAPDALSFTWEENTFDALTPGIEEHIVVLDALSFIWEEDTFDVLAPWIEKGNHLFVYYNFRQDAFRDKDFYSFVNHFDVKMITPDNEDDFSSETETNDNNSLENAEPQNQTSNEAGTSSGDSENRIDMDQIIWFKIDNNRNDILMAGIDNETINLVCIPYGKGSVTFTGRPYFMRNINLRKNANRMLTWNLTGAKDEDKQGILFVRETEFENTFFQDLFHEGNIFPLLISVFVLIIVCFWGFIPRFGKIIADEESPGKPIRERFLAEAVFLKKFHSLKSYIDVYEKTIQQRFRKNYGEYIDDKKIFCLRLAEITKLDAAIIEQSLYPKRFVTSGTFLKCMNTIETIMERL